MPNWSATSYIVTGDPNGISKLYKTLQKMNHRKKPKINNGFGPMWLGELVNELGGNWEAIRCRGNIEDFEKHPDGTISMFMESAWCEQSETRHFLEATLNLKIYYLDEESGLAVYQTNDTTGKYFPDRFLLDNEDEPLYFQTIEDAAVTITSIVGHPVEATVEAIEKALEDYEKDHEDENTWYSFHAYEVIDN